MDWTKEVVWVSGVTGAWGQELCRQLAERGAQKIIGYSRDEHKQAACRERFHGLRFRWHLGDVRQAEILRWSMKDATVVIHAAAMKRVESGLESPLEMASVNIDGTRCVIHAVLGSPHVRRAFYISTDKACEPTTLYGATKLVAESCWRGANVYSPAPEFPWFSAGRYGNVLWSTGSVLHVWKRQVENGQALTIHDPEATRYLLTKREAVGYVLEALEWCRGGDEMFVPSGLLARGVTMGTLAAAFAGEGYPWKITGLPSHAKRHERLLPSWPHSGEGKLMDVDECCAVFACAEGDGE